MDRILQEGKRAYYSAAIEQPRDFHPPFGGQPYPCLLWDHAGQLTAEERSKLADALIASNCCYAVCAGVDCEAWEDSVDDVFARTSDASANVSDERHVMTTAHSNESVDDVALFFVRNTNFGEHDFHKFLILHVGGSSADRQLVVDAVRREALGETAV
jgi:hypothetical protein